MSLGKWIIFIVILLNKPYKIKTQEKLNSIIRKEKSKAKDKKIHVFHGYH